MRQSDFLTALAVVRGNQLDHNMAQEGVEGECNSCIISRQEFSLSHQALFFGK